MLCRIDSWIDNNLDLDEYLDGLKGTDIWNLCQVGTNDLNGQPNRSKQKQCLKTIMLKKSEKWLIDKRIRQQSKQIEKLRSETSVK